MTKHIPDAVGDDPRDVAWWQESLRAIVPVRRETSRIIGTTISTRMPTLDRELDGGLLRGQAVEIFGPEPAVTSALVYHVLAEAQRRGGVCAFVDVGSRLDLLYGSRLDRHRAQQIGVKVDELLRGQANTGEEALRLAKLLASSGKVDVVVVDSMTTVTTGDPPDGTPGNTTFHRQARIMWQPMSELVRDTRRTHTLCLITYQFDTRQVPRSYHPARLSLGLYSAQRLDIRQLGTSQDCARVKVDLTRNAGANWFRAVTLDMPLVQREERSSASRVVPDGECIRPVTMVDQLMQDEFWVDARGLRKRVCDLAEGHLRKILARFEAMAPQILHAAQMTMLCFAPPQGEMAQDLFYQELDETMDTSPMEYLNSCPLVKALRRELSAREASRSRNAGARAVQGARGRREHQLDALS